MDSTVPIAGRSRVSWPRRRTLVTVACALLVTFTNPGCAANRIAVNELGNAIAGRGTIYASDDDAGLVQSAVRFGLKRMERLLEEESPKHRGLLLAACKGFTEYCYAFVQEDGDEIEVTNLAEASRLRVVRQRSHLSSRSVARSDELQIEAAVGLNSRMLRDDLRTVSALPGIPTRAHFQQHRI